MASRAKEHRQQKFAAALKGIDLDEGSKDSAKERFEAVQRRVESKLSGESQDKMELFELGIEFETDEEEE